MLDAAGVAPSHRRQRDAQLLTAPLARVARSRVIDQDPAHRLRRDRKEMNAILGRSRARAVASLRRVRRKPHVLVGKNRKKERL